VLALQFGRLLNNFAPLGRRGRHEASAGLGSHAPEVKAVGIPAEADGRIGAGATVGMRDARKGE
jgi:hypothetical protein